MTDPLIIYVPGLLPKPEPAAHRAELWRCLTAGVRRFDAAVAADLASRPDAFDLVSWTYDFYGEHRDVALDAADIDAVIEQAAPAERDIVEAVSWRRRMAVALYRVGDLMPFLIPRLADEKLEVHLRDLRRYNRNDNDIAEHTRRLLKLPLEAAARARRPVLLIAHSMGSVIAFDALWQLSRDESNAVAVDTWLTMGSPLGQNYLQKRLLGRNESGKNRYPNNVRRWINVAAFGDMTALDRRVGDDFEGMLQLGLVETITDIDVFNHYRTDGVLNTHAEYGYLVNEITARVVGEWWREQRSSNCADSTAAAPARDSA